MKKTLLTLALGLTTLVCADAEEVDSYHYPSQTVKRYTLDKEPALKEFMRWFRLQQKLDQAAAEPDDQTDNIYEISIVVLELVVNYQANG